MGSGRKANGGKKLKYISNRIRTHNASDLKNRKEVPRPTGISKCLIGLLITGILTIATYQLYQHHSYQNLTVSRVLRRFVENANQRIDHELQMEAFLLEDPLVDLIKTELLPIQARVSSLRTQTSQYEKMEQIPGGPINFITSALFELNTDVETRLNRLCSESLTLLAAYNRKWNSIVKSCDKIFAILDLLQDKDSIMILAQEGMIIVPESTGNADQIEMDKLADQVSLEEVTNMLDTLASLYEELEKMDEMEELQQQEIEDKLVQISKYRNRYGKYLQVFQLLISRHSTRWLNMLAQVQSNINEKRGPFLQLHSDISKDTQNLEVRIENLKYKYVKKSSEL